MRCGRAGMADKKRGRTKTDIVTEDLRKLHEIASSINTIGQYRESLIKKDAVERNLQRIADVYIDLGKTLISHLKLRTPGNSRMVFTILAEQGEFPHELVQTAHNLVGLRNIIVHGYDKIDDAMVYGTIKKKLGEIRKINKHFITAFSKENISRLSPETESTSGTHAPGD